LLLPTYSSAMVSFKTLTVGAALLTSSFVLASSDVPTDVPVSELLKTASAHLAAGRSQDALSFFDAAISRDPQNYLSVFKRGAAYLSLGKSSQAERDFDKVLLLKPGFEGALVQRAKIKTRNGEWNAAKADYLAAGKKDTTELAELDEGQKAAALAVEAESKQDWDECINQAGIALSVAPAVLRLRNLRSKCRLENGDVESAVTDMQHVLALGSGSTEPYIQVSALRFYALAEPDKGLETIRKCLHSDPDNKACRKIMRQEKSLDKRLRKMVEAWDKSSYASAAKMLVKSSEEDGLILESKADFDELVKEGIIHPKAPNGLTNHLYDRACEAYIQVSNSFSLRQI
jgi:DnaJ homolog subfamily C member 3